MRECPHLRRSRPLSGDPVPALRGELVDQAGRPALGGQLPLARADRDDPQPAHRVAAEAEPGEVRNLGTEQLRRIIDIELDMVQQRIEAASARAPFTINVTESGRDFLLTEGIDSRYGARHLKRAIERLLVQPLANLIASGQIQRGDHIRVSHREGSPTLMFFHETGASAAWNAAGLAAA